jgi:spermidine synthase
MTLWQEVARAEMPGGDVLTLRRRGDEFEIRFNLYELMSSRNAVSESALATVVCARVACRQVLIGGLGMSYTLRSVLERLASDARVTVAELVPDVIAWNRGPLAKLTGHPLDDSRVTVCNSDVADVLRTKPGGFDAILMDVDNGPDAVFVPANHFLYAADGVELIRSALAPGGVFGLWSADRSPKFEHVLETGGFRFERIEVDVRGAHGPTHTIYLVPAHELRADAD